MDQNPIKILKLRYRNKLLCNIVAQGNAPVQEMLKTNNIRDAILLLKSAWEDLPTSVLQNACNKIKNWDETQCKDEDDIPLSILYPSNASYNSAIEEVQILLSKIVNNSEVNLQNVEDWNEDFIENQNINAIDIDSDTEEIEDPIESSVSYMRKQ